MYRYMESKKGGKDAGKQKEKEKKSLRRGTPIFLGGGEFGDRDPLFYFNFNFKSLYEKQPIIEV